MFLTVGTMVGVGLLAVPVLLGLAGFVPGMTAMAVVVLLAWSSGFALAERMMDRFGSNGDGDVASLYQQDLGTWTRWVTLPGYLLLFYALLVAYVTGAANILAQLATIPISLKVWVFMVFLVATCF